MRAYSATSESQLYEAAFRRWPIAIYIRRDAAEDFLGLSRGRVKVVAPITPNRCRIGAMLIGPTMSASPLKNNRRCLMA